MNQCSTQMFVRERILNFQEARQLKLQKCERDRGLKLPHLPSALSQAKSVLPSFEPSSSETTAKSIEKRPKIVHLQACP